MAYEDLLRSVEESAQEKELALRKKAASTIEEIQKRARTKAEAIGQAHIDQAKKSITTERNKLLYLTNVENKELFIRVREAGFEKAFHEAATRLLNIRLDPKYPAIFEKLLVEATSTLGGEAFSVHVDPRDEDLCKKSLAALGISADILTDITSAGGVVVNLPGDSVVISNTIESRLQRARERSRKEIHAILAGA
ncbi:MAG: V-type ATP synthase subunit E [Methanoregula sp.]|jgi:V/A-type H+-transporting ATPase subunit E